MAEIEGLSSRRNEGSVSRVCGWLETRCFTTQKLKPLCGYLAGHAAVLLVPSLHSAVMSRNGGLPAGLGQGWHDQPLALQLSLWYADAHY